MQVMLQRCAHNQLPGVAPKQGQLDSSSESFDITIFGQSWKHKSMAAECATDHRSLLADIENCCKEQQCSLKLQALGMQQCCSYRMS